MENGAPFSQVRQLGLAIFNAEKKDLLNQRSNFLVNDYGDRVQDGTWESDR